MMNNPDKGTGPLRVKPAHSGKKSSPPNAPSTEPTSAELPARLEGTGQLASGEGRNTRQLRMLPKLATDIQPWRVIFQTMTPEPRVIGVDVQAVAVVGRADPQANTAPDLDLAEFGGQAMGVSRRHAILLPTEEGLCLIDLDSTNGTWVNGVYLQPGQKYRLRTGDRVEFGRLRLVVRVIGAMLQGRDNSEWPEATAVTRPKPKRD